MPDNPSKIFISYARDESHGQNLATSVQQQLQGAGFDVFRDVIGLKPGESFPHRLEFELESSDLMVLVISEKVRRSEWVYNEFSLAKQLEIPVIPLLAEETRLPLWLQNVQVLNCLEGFSLNELLRAFPNFEPENKERKKLVEESPTKGSTLIAQVFDKLTDEEQREVMSYMSYFIKARESEVL